LSASCFKVGKKEGRRKVKGKKEKKKKKERRDKEAARIFSVFAQETWAHSGRKRKAKKEKRKR